MENYCYAVCCCNYNNIENENYVDISLFTSDKKAREFLIESALEYIDNFLDNHDYEDEEDAFESIEWITNDDGEKIGCDILTATGDVAYFGIELKEIK